MKFGERLLSTQHPPWSTSYIDYKRLKRLLNPLFGLQEEVVTSSPEDGGAPTSDSGSNSYAIASPLHYDDSTAPTLYCFENVSAVTSSRSFQKELNYEIQKAMLFLLKSMGELASDISLLSGKCLFLDH